MRLRLVVALAYASDRPAGSRVEMTQARRAQGALRGTESNVQSEEYGVTTRAARARNVIAQRQARRLARCRRYNLRSPCYTDGTIADTRP